MFILERIILKMEIKNLVRVKTRRGLRDWLKRKIQKQKDFVG